jgi:hypothetical protein
MAADPRVAAQLLMPLVVAAFVASVESIDSIA